MLGDDVLGEPLQIDAMLRFCFDVSTESFLQDPVIDYGGIKVVISRSTEEEKIEQLACRFSQAKWIIDYMAQLESNKLKKQLGG